MPRFFFDVTLGQRHARDSEGLNLDDERTARQEASAILPAMAREAAATGVPQHLTLAVRNEAGDLIFEGQITTTEDARGASASSETDNGEVREPRF